MKFRVLNICLAFAVALTLASCGGGGSGSSSGSGSSTGSSGGSGSGSGGGSSSGSIESSLIGTWKSVCQFIGGPQPYTITIVTFQSGGQETNTVLWYSDSGCSSATGIKKVDQETYSIGASVIASGKSAYKIDATMISWVMTQDGSTVLTGGSAPTEYAIFAIEGDTLYFDDNPDSVTSASSRPTTLGLDIYYTRQ